LGKWFRHITNNVRAINVPSDLKGIKLRTPKSKWRVKMFQSYGANPTPMSFSEVFTALQTGTMDGQENPYAQITSAKFQEVQKISFNHRSRIHTSVRSSSQKQLQQATWRCKKDFRICCKRKPSVRL